MAKNVTKPWNQQFFEVKDIDAGNAPTTILKPPKHGLTVKGEKNADKHPRAGH